MVNIRRLVDEQCRSVLSLSWAGIKALVAKREGIRKSIATKFQTNRLVNWDMTTVFYNEFVFSGSSVATSYIFSKSSRNNRIECFT